MNLSFSDLKHIKYICFSLNRICHSHGYVACPSFFLYWTTIIIFFIFVCCLYHSLVPLFLKVMSLSTRQCDICSFSDNFCVNSQVSKPEINIRITLCSSMLVFLRVINFNFCFWVYSLVYQAPSKLVVFFNWYLLNASVCQSLMFVLSRHINQLSVLLFNKMLYLAVAVL